MNKCTQSLRKQNKEENSKKLVSLRLWSGVFFLFTTPNSHIGNSSAMAAAIAAVRISITAVRNITSVFIRRCRAEECGAAHSFLMGRPKRVSPKKSKTDSEY